MWCDGRVQTLNELVWGPMSSNAAQHVEFQSRSMRLPTALTIGILRIGGFCQSLQAEEGEAQQSVSELSTINWSTDRTRGERVASPPFPSPSKNGNSHFEITDVKDMSKPMCINFD